MASVVAVCISEKKGVMKHPVEYIDVKQIHGILPMPETGIGKLAFLLLKV